MPEYSEVVICNKYLIVTVHLTTMKVEGGVEIGEECRDECIKLNV
jgi:hypothetical protein